MALKTTPEEKLFAVIQGAHHPPLRSMRPKLQAISLSSFGAMLYTMLSSWDLLRTNQLMLIICALLGALCIINPLFMRPRLDWIIKKTQQRVKPFSLPPPLEGMRSLDENVQLMKSQDPFRIEKASQVGTKALEAEPTKEPPKPDYTSALNDLKLVGISWGTDLTAMIEQKSTSQTFFLKRGDTIGPFTVGEILNDRVTLNVDDQKFELF